MCILGHSNSNVWCFWICYFDVKCQNQHAGDQLQEKPLYSNHFVCNAAGIRNFKKFWTKSETDKPTRKAKKDSKDDETRDSKGDKTRKPKSGKTDEKKDKKEKKRKSDDTDHGDAKPNRKAKKAK